MENTARQLGAQLQAKVVGHVALPQQPAQHAAKMPETEKDSFLSGAAGQTWLADHLKRELSRVLAEISEMQAAGRWQDIVALFHPVEDKLPELADAGMDGEVRLKLSFALCRAAMHEQAIACLQPVVAREQENSLANYNIGYSVLDYFFHARTERRLIPAKRRGELIKLAHHHFDIARRLRPDSVTFCYRQAILYKEIENKPKMAVPLFSVFECADLNEQGLLHIQAKLDKIIDHTTDTVRYYRICKGCVKEIEWNGTGKAPDTDTFKVF